jgi:tetratricopeptide (TPR) repeat protein
MSVRWFSCQILLGFLCLSADPSIATAQNPDEIKGAPAEPSDAQETHREIEAVRKLQPSLPDRGAALYFLAVAQQHLRNSLEALDLLKQCVALQEGFDPSGDAAFLEFKGNKEFTALIENVHKQFPSLAQAREAFRTTEKDLIPEGLAYDEQRNVFYMSSLHRRKIIKIAQDAVASDFVSPEQLALLPVLGIHLSPDDETVWADSFSDNGQSELLHFDGAGKLLGRFQPPGTAKHGLNDFVIRKSGELITTDSLANAVYRFDPATHAFAPVPVHRLLFYPNGIALSADDNALYIADELGVIRVDLTDGVSRDVDPGPRNTLAGIDGLYWYKGSLVAVQNGIGSPRIVAFRLASDGLHVTHTTVLENRTSFTILPTTGTIHGSDFFFIANSQIDNLNGDKVMDVTKLEPVRVGVVRLPN